MTGTTTLLPLEAALEALLASTTAIGGREVSPLAEAAGRILARDVAARLDAPPWDNSAMDGFALRSGDAAGVLPVLGRVAAGDAPSVLPPGAAMRIFTGAPLPEGADAVVMQEMAHWSRDGCTAAGASPPAAAPQPGPGADGDGPGQLVVEGPVAPGQHIRRRGEECRRGERLLPAGRRLRPQDIGLLASQGMASVAVKPRLRVALLSTGSELREAGSGELSPGMIYNSNRPMLAAMLGALGCVVEDHGLVEDTPAATRSALLRAAERADLLLTSGGVSVGEADHVRDAVAELGSIDLWRVAVKPGKPFAFGAVRGTPFMGLPGNPASAFVTFALLARPWLCARQGRCDLRVPTFPGRADFSTARPGTRDEYLRVSLHRLPSPGDGNSSPVDGVASPDGHGEPAGACRWIRPYTRQSSGILRSVVESDALARVPAGCVVRHGDELEIMTLDALLV